MGLMWPIMPDENAVHDAAAQADITKLAELLALRRIEVAELEDEVAGFATTYKGDPQILTRVFAEVFDTLSQRRSRIINYRADLDALRSVMLFLVKDCCGGRAELCHPLADELLACRAA